MIAVVAVGGSVNDEDANTASLNADLYDPGANTFSSAGANVYPRLYHSVALLLPDANRMACRWQSFARQLRVAHGDLISRLSIYQGLEQQRNTGDPADHCQCPEPEHDHVGRAVYGFYPDAASISQVVLARLGSSTHALTWTSGS